MFTLYALCATCLIFYLVFTVAPRLGTSNIFVYLAICSLVGSFTVMSCKALGEFLLADWTARSKYRRFPNEPVSLLCSSVLMLYKLESSTYSPFHSLLSFSVGVAVKLTLSGNNQFVYPETYAFLVLMVSCITTQVSTVQYTL